MKTLYLKDIGRDKTRVGYQKSYGVVGEEFVFEYGKGQEFKDSTAEKLLKQNPHLVSEKPAVIVKPAEPETDYIALLAEVKTMPAHKRVQAIAKEIGINSFGLKKPELLNAVTIRLEELTA